MVSILRAVVIWAVMAAPALAQDFAGAAAAVDTDKIRIGSQMILIYGIDSIDRREGFCNLNNRTFDCYSVALRQMEILVDEGPVSCTTVAEDRYQRPIATCEVGGRDLGLAMIEAGMAFAFRMETDKYVAAEEAAEAADVGLWRAEFSYPWVYRAALEGNAIER